MVGDVLKMQKRRLPCDALKLHFSVQRGLGKPIETWIKTKEREMEKWVQPGMN